MHLLLEVLLPRTIEYAVASGFYKCLPVHTVKTRIEMLLLDKPDDLVEYLLSVLTIKTHGFVEGEAMVLVPSPIMTKPAQ